MSRKWVEKESQRWTELGIVSPKQVEQILGLYTEKTRTIGLIPLLGSLLIGLGVLSFVGANWQQIPQLVRLAMIIILMSTFYGAGETILRRGQEKLGIAFIGMGLITFGAGIILIGQMFHLVAYDAVSFLIWSIAGILLTYLYRSRFLYLITCLLLAITQFYSAVQFDRFSYTAMLLFLIGLGAYLWFHKDALLSWCFSTLFIIQAIVLLQVNEWKFLWLFLPLMFLYTLGDWTPNRKLSVALQAMPMISAFAINLFLVLFDGNFGYNDRYDWVPAPLPYLISLLILIGISLYGKLRVGRGSSSGDWLLAAPLFYLTNYSDVAYILVLFVFSLFLLWRGYTEEWRFKINLGTLLFLISTMTAYGKLTWGFMDKSLFFLIGGVLLIGLSWLLNRRRKNFFEDRKEGNFHD
jgi:uncharacterized membrane protein